MITIFGPYEVERRTRMYVYISPNKMLFIQLDFIPYTSSACMDISRVNQRF